MSDPSRISELFARWQESHSRGVVIRAEELCHDCPQLVQPLQESIDAWLASELAQLETLEPYPVDAPASAAGGGAMAATGPASTLDGRPVQAGNYRIIEEIARGGMGAVFRAFDPEFQRTLAVKVMLQPAAERPDLAERFLAEARITGKLQHPGIPPAHELGKLEDGRPFFAMKLIEGRTLAKLLRERASETNVTHSPEDLSRLLNIFRQVCETMAYAHSHGVIHRDLKPDNVMVGAFGEVQVMDWGLAKVLRATEHAPASRHHHTPTDTEVSGRGSDPGGRSPSAEETLDGSPHDGRGAREAVFAQECWSDTELSMRTEAGDVIGTLEYMPPEQACGAVDRLDARCDVFGLGAILCRILTGHPPYAAANTGELWRQAAEGRLHEAFARLDHSGADPELVRLARSCLAPAREDRPRDAGVVAQMVAGHQARVADGLRRAELDRQATRVKAAEERKRRTVWLALIGTVLILLVGAGFWWQNRRAEQAARRSRLQARTTSALQEIENLQGQSRFKEAEIVLAQAKSTLGVAGPASLRRRLDRAAAYLRVLLDLEEISFSKMETMQRKADLPRTARAYERRFRDPPLEVHPGMSPDLVAQQLQSLSIRKHLVRALDDWAKWAGSKHDQRGWCLAVARLLDPGPWRDRFRDPAVWRDRGALERLASDADVKSLPPRLLSTLGHLLRKRGCDATALLKAAHLQHPDSLWINHELGFYLTDQGGTDENKAAGVAFFRAALAIRPDVPVNHTNLAWALLRNGDLEAAVTHCRKALEIDPESALAYANLGAIQSKRGDLDGAIQYYRQAVACDPNLAWAWNNLGRRLWDKGDVKGAIENYRRAIEADPRHALALCNLGEALFRVGDSNEALDCFHRAIAADPPAARTYVLLGNGVYTGDRARAIEAYRKAIELDPRYAHGHFSLGYALIRDDPDEAARALRTAIELNPEYSPAHRYLGDALIRQGRFTEACRAYERALALLPAKAPAREQIAGLLERGRRLVQLEGWLARIRDGRGSAKDAAELIELAQLCGRYKKLYASAANFYAAAFAADPGLAQDADHGHRYTAARVALLAADGKGREGGEIQPVDRVRWRRQALTWLEAERADLRDRLTPRPATVIAVQDALSKWRQDPDLAVIREEESLSELPRAEQHLWRGFWSAVEQLRAQAAAHCVETRLEGTLSRSQLEVVHPLEMDARATYVIDMTSPRVDCFLRLEDAQSRMLDENDDIVRTRIRDARITYTPEFHGCYRIVATSHRKLGRGSYRILIRQFRAPRDK